MAENEGGGGEQDDISFLRTGDIVSLTCVANREGVMGTERISLSAEGFGNRMCYLENVSDKNYPPDMAICMFNIDDALSIRALQEMMSADSEAKAGGKGGHKTLLYGHAIQLLHSQSNMYLACLSTSSSSDKLAFDVGVQESSKGEACWWTIHPASKQRSEGEKVRVGDDVILVSVATERYVHMSGSKGAMVVASFHQTLWNINPVSSGSVRTRNMGYIFGNDCVRFYHGNDEVLTIPENWSEHPQHNMVIYEGGPAVTQARSLWRLELVRMKWHGALINWEQVFRVRHMTSGRYLGLASDNQVCLLHRDKAEFDASGIIMLPAKDTKRQGIEEKEEEGMGAATLKYGENSVFLQHLHTSLWISYSTTEVTKKGIGKVEEKKAVALEEGHMDDNFTFFMALEEESKSARVIRKCSSVLNRFLRGIDGLETEGIESPAWQKVDLEEVLKLMEDLIDYFAQPADECEFEERQNCFRALRSRQDLFQEEGVLNMILDTIDKFSKMESLPDYTGLIGPGNQDTWESISTYLYLLVAAMIKGNHSNCAQFAAAQRLDWLFGRLANPQSAEGILDVLYCVLTESPEALNMIGESHIKSVISLLEKVGRDPKVLDVLSSLCEGNGVAVRSSQNTIASNLLPVKDLLLQTSLVDHTGSMMPNILVGVVEGSAWFQRWYFECEIEHVEQMTKQPPFLRVGWANTMGFIPYPGCGDMWGCNGIGDDLFSFGFDGRVMWTGGKGKPIGTRDLRKGDVIGCFLDLTLPEIRFTLNGNKMDAVFKDFNTDGFFFPVMSLSAKVSCRFILGGNQGRLRYGPPQGFSAMYEAIHGELEIVPCFSFGNLKKSTYCGPQTILNNIKPFVPEPVAVTSVNLPQYAHELHEKLAENMHELWATHKIDNGWTFAEKRSETKKQHPCLTSYDRLPAVERNYNLTQALDMLKTIYALGYHMTIDKPPTRLRPIRLPQNYQMSNGYKPAPLDSREITLDEKMLELTELLAENTHNTWAKEKIARGWTYGISEDPINKRTPHLVPYEVVIPQIKAANREGAAETIRTLMLYGLYFEAPAVEHDEAANREMEALKQIFRTYRAEKTYTVTGGKWYFEFEVLSTGFMKVGWLDASANADADLGIDDLSYGFDGYLVKKWHQGMEQYGRAWKVGDVIGCFLDLNDRTISYSMNGELLLDPSGSEMAFDNVQVGDGFLPAFTLAAGQKAKLNFGQDANSLRYFTTCGLQEGYEPFCVNMYRNMACWYGKELGLFENLGHIQNAPVQVIRVPATGNNPPCLKITHATPGTPTDKVKIEYLRISMPVRCNDVFVRNKDREDLHQNLARLRDQHRVETGQPPLLSGRFQIPKEFGSSSNLKVIKEGEKVSMTNLAPPSPKTAADKRLTLSGAKAQSFDETNVLETSTLDPPAVRSATSLQDLGMDETEDSAQRAAAVERIKELQKGDGQRSRTPLKMLQTISKKVRDVSASSRKKAEKDMPRSRSNDTPTSTLKSSRITEEVGIGRSDLPPSGPARAGTIRKTKGRSGKSPIIEIVDTSKTTGGEVPLSADDDTWEMKQMIEQIDEFYYGLRIFPGQDPAQVWVGWVTPQFHFAGQSFSLEDDVRKVCYFEKDNQNGVLEDTEYRSCYAANAQELSASVNDQSTDAKVSGLLIGCLVDTSTGELSFLANGQETGVKFKLEPSAMVYPAVFFMASSKDVCQFELGRIKYTLPLSAIIFRSSYKALTPICPPRLKLQLLRQNHWARVPDNCIRITSLRLSETRGWSVLCDDPVRMMAVYVPEKDRSFDVLELIEHSFYLAFHVQTLHLYCKLCAHGNHKVAHILCKHVEQEQLMYAIKSHHLSGQLRAGFHDMLIAVHLSYHAEARMLTTNEYLIPLLKELESKNVFSLEYESKYPAVLGQPYSILPVMAAEDVRDRIPRDVETKLQPPAFNFEALKIHVMESLADATQRAVMNCRDLIGGDNASHFEPLLKVCHTLLVMGLMTDEDIKHILMLIDPADFDPNYKAGTTQKGMIEIVLDEGVKVQLCHLLNSLCDMQLRNRVESLIAFAEGFVYELQQDQRSRYLDIKQSDMSPAEAAKKTKEFRCPPREQMDRLVNCKNKPEAEMVGEEMELEQCPMVERLQEQLRDFVGHMNKKMGCKPQEDAEAVQSLIQAEDDTSWVDTLATFVVPVPPAPAEEDEAASRRGQEAFRRMIIKAVARWAAEGVIESAELIREMFGLLIRQYNGVAEIMKALETTYIIHEVSICDVEDFIIYLNQVRSLLLVQFEWCEEETLKNALWHLMNNKVFFQHPDLMRLLRVHENVMTVMMNILTTQQAAESVTEEHSEFLAPQLRDTSDLVVSCSKFLCYFCRTSRTNQKAMFEHLSFLLDNATMLLNRPSVRGSVPLDVAYSSFMDNNELALALKEDELEKVAIYLSRCGLQPNADLIAKGYPDLGWDPVEGERYVDFLRCCVWINGESIEENANLVIRLLIRRPECLGVALKGEGQGLYLAFKEAIAMSEDIKAMAEGKDEPHGGVYLGMGMTYPSEEDEGEDYLDMGAAILQFYASLVDLLAKCAPDPLTIHEGKGESLRARAILRSLISLDDLESILSLKFTIPNVAAHPNEDISGMPPGLIPNHKKSALLFLDRVYGIADQEMFFRLLEESFLPDLRAATMLDSLATPRYPTKIEPVHLSTDFLNITSHITQQWHQMTADSGPKEIDIAFRLNRYLCNAVLPLLTRHAAFFADAEHEAALLDATLHTVYRMNRLKALTNTQRQAVSDFLVNITAELNPNMMIKLLTKVIVDIPALEENAMVPLKIMTLHYERCGKYYGTGNQYGVASEVEKRLSMKLFSAIFDSLGTKPYDPELFGRALPCLTAIGCALSPDYALIPVQDESEPQASDLGSAWTPKPIDVSSISLSPEITGMVDKFAEHFHDSWASRKIAKGWIHGDHYSRTDFTHPRLKPFALLQATEKKFYKERCAECVRPLLAYHYEIKLTDPDAAERAAQASHPSGNSINNYHPHPVDLSNMSLAQDMHNIAEKMSENSHLIWAKIALDDLCDRGGSMLASIVPWDLLTDFEKRKDRFRAKEVLKFLQYHGYTITNNGTDREEGFAGPAKMEVSDRAVEKRFAYNLLEKVHMYLEQAGIRMKVIKPSQDLTRRNSFKPSSKDVKFFEKVVLPLIEAYFNAHRVYFITSSAVFQAGMASNKEKELVAGLFCRLSYLLRLKNHAFGSVGKLTVTCLTVLVQAMDMRTLVKVNSDIIRTSLLTFFNHRADDLHAAVSDFKSEGQYSSLRGKNIKSWVSLEFANQMSLPILTALFQHLARSGFGTDLLVDDIQACCYKILNSLYYLANLSGHATNRAASIKAEIDKHRPPLGQCLSAFASCFPVAFLEPEFNANNKASVLSKYLEQGSVQIQEMMQNLAAHIPQLEKMMADLETAAENSVKYADSPNIFDVDLPLVCSYLSYWWQQGPEGSSQPDKQVTDVTSEHVNRMFLVVLKFLRDGVGVEDAPWLCRLPFFAVQIINYVTCDPVKNYILPIAERLRKVTENSWKEEDRLRTHPEDADEGAVAETNARLVRDVYAFMPLLVKYTDLHRAQWLKSPSWETDGIYENIAIIFKIWSRSQHFKREELNFMTQFEEAMRGGVGEPKTGGAAIADRKKKRRDGGKKDKHASSLVIQCLKRLLPVGLNVFGGRELDIVQQSKEKFLKKEGEEKIRDFIRSLLGVPEKTDPTDKNTWQRNLYHKIGKSQMRGKESMTQDGVIEKIASMGQVMSILHSVEHPANQGEGVWRKIVSSQRKRAIFACFRQTAVYCLTSYRWLADEDVGQDQLVADICEIEETSDESTVAVVSSAAAVTIGDDEDQEESKTPDALTQLVQCFQRAATSEQQQAISICDDALYNSYADVLAKSIHVAEEDGGGDDEEEVDQAEKEEEAEQLRAEQSRLADRGVATLVLQYLSASGGEPCDMVAKTLLLGINILNGGNKDVQTMMLDYQRLKRDVRFFTSLAGLMNGCSVLNLEMFERQIKAEGLGMGAELAAGEHQNLNDVDFICSLFRFLQLTCEGHNSDFQNYLRTQPGHTTSVNLINSTVDYLLRLQESIMDFYWHYSSKDMIDEGGKEHFLKAIQVCSQVFNTLTESIQGPCVGNQTTLANSRLWDAINGFFFLFAHMMDKLSKNSTQLELLREFLNLQKDMIVLMLSMLEGNVLNGPIGKQMVDALVESQQNVEMILKFFDMFLKLRDLTTSQAFMEFDLNKDGWISPKEFQKAMESQKMYSIEEINYLMMCTDVNNDGKVDYMEFTERFHNPAKDIGFNLAVLLTNLKEHIVGDPRLEKILQTAGSMLEYFDQYLGRIEIMGSAKRVEKVYFEIQEDWLEQWGKQQIRDSKNSFLFNVMQDDGGDQGKLEAFINFCEDTIFEMQHAAEISAEDSDARMERAMSQRDHFLNQSSGAHQVKEALQMGASMGLSAIDAIRPSNINAGFKSKLKAIKAMTIPQMCFQSYKTSVRTTYNIFWVLYLIVSTILRFFYFMMTSREEEVAAPAALPMPDHGRLKRDLSKGMGATIHAAMPDVHVPVPAEQSFEAFGSQDEPDAGLHARQDSSKQPTPQASMDQPTSPTPTVAEGVTSPKGTSVYETGSVYAGGSIMLPAGAPMTSVGSEDESGLFYEPKIAESAGPRSKSSPLNFLARNIKTFEAAALYLTFFLNFILLFHRVSVSEAENGNGDGGGDGDDEDEELLETVFITGITLPYGYDLTGWILGQVLYWVSVVHAIISVALLFAFYQLKVPLMTFKREKEVSRRLLFEGCWITEEEDEERSVVDTVFWYLDRIVISSTLFPAKYWDKFVRKKSGAKFSDQADEHTMNSLLGLDKTPSEDIDFRYNTWLWFGVIITNGQFLYRVGYLIASLAGVFGSPFFYATHLIDVVLSYPMLKAILQSVTHNLTQLVLTIMMTIVVVYLYAVVAFNFFRKFYVQEEEEGEEPDRKCHNMLTCFIYHFYAGVRAGGGIGDELESPYGDASMYWRMLFDITFFFFVIVILLAIMQGLIIDAFGELRSQQESATEKLESNCFVCDIGKEFFDRLPRGFENHVSKEHNFANYLFFLQHLINKDDTEYTGQETYVREMYDERNWEFFPVGECFLKQYEDTLMAS